MKKGMLATLAFLLIFAGTVYAADAMKVSVNGKAISLKTAPRFTDNVLMVPLAEVAQTLGIGAKWNVGTNTLELTDERDATIASLKQQLSEANAEIDRLKKQGPAPSPASTSGPTRDNLVAFLNEKYGTYKSGDQTVHVTWERNPFSDASDPLYSAEIADGDYGIVLFAEEKSMLRWFNEAAVQIAMVHPKASAVLVYHTVYSSYPTADYDNVRLTDDLDWAVTDYIIWSFIENGVAESSMDDD